MYGIAGIWGAGCANGKHSRLLISGTPSGALTKFVGKFVGTIGAGWDRIGEVFDAVVGESVDVVIVVITIGEYSPIETTPRRDPSLTTPMDVCSRPPGFEGRVSAVARIIVGPHCGEDVGEVGGGSA